MGFRTLPNKMDETMEELLKRNNVKKHKIIKILGPHKEYKININKHIEETK